MKQAINQLIDLAFDLNEGGHGAGVDFNWIAVTFYLRINGTHPDEDYDLYKMMTSAEEILLLIKEVKEIMLNHAKRYQEKCEALNG